MSIDLLKAIEAGDLDRVAVVLAAGADPSAIVMARYGLDVRITPLQAAVRELRLRSDLQPHGKLDAIVLLLRNGADVDGRDGPTDTTPLLMAVEAKHIEAVRILLAAGADPNVCDGEGSSPLRFCARNGLLEMARLLLHCGANKTIHEAGGDTGMNALGMAAYWLHVDIAKLLLAHGADPNVPDNDRMTVFDHLRLMDPPNDPASQSRLHEIRSLLGEPKT